MSASRELDPATLMAEHEVTYDSRGVEWCPDCYESWPCLVYRLATEVGQLTEAKVRSTVPNKPKTKTRGFRIPDDEYEAAQETAERRGETVTDEVRRALRAYVRRNR